MLAPLANLLWTAIVGGTQAAPCEYPTTVSVAPCSGVLVDPEWVLTAGHCGDLTRAAFGADVDGSTGATVAITECVAHPDGLDAGLCRLASPQLQVPVIPPLLGCEVDQLADLDTAVIVGFGRDENWTTGYKRMATATLGAVSGATLRIGGDGVDGCSGDSGGPAFVQLADATWRLAAIAVTGDAACSDGGDYLLLSRLVPWIEETTGLDVSPCHDRDGRWNPDARCRWLPVSPGSGDWLTGCTLQRSLEPGHSCGAPFAAPADTSGPSVELLAPVDGATFTSDPELGAARVDVSAMADSPWGIDRIELALDGETVGYIRGSSSEALVTAPPGAHELAAVALDYDGASAEVRVGLVVDPGDTGGCRMGRHAPFWLVVVLLGLHARARSTVVANARAKRPRGP